MKTEIRMSPAVLDKVRTEVETRLGPDASIERVDRVFGKRLAEITTDVLTVLAADDARRSTLN